MVNALLGAVQTQAMLADAVELDEEDRHAAWREQLTSAGAWDDAAEGLHVLLGVVGSSYQAVAAGDVETLAAQSGLLRAARDSLQTAIGNTEILLDMLKSVGL